MLAIVNQFRQNTKLRWNGISRFQPKVQLRMRMGPYELKTADSPEELMASFKLRHQVFRQEFCETPVEGLDFDKFDFSFDHLIIVHQETGKLIGTYRLNCSDFSSQSYTSLEFDMKALSQTSGPYLELGRACIHKDFRKGSVIALLWRGIAEYMNLCGAQVLFGCSSLKINNPRQAALVYHRLGADGVVDANLGFKPTAKYTMKGFEPWLMYFQDGLSEAQAAEAQELIPSLLSSYLKLGAKVCAKPAFDSDFDCIDLLTILRRADLDQSIAKKFQVVK